MITMMMKILAQQGKATPQATQKNLSVSAKDFDSVSIEEVVSVAPALSEDQLKLFKMSAQDVLTKVRKDLAAYGYKNITVGKEFVYATGSIPILLVAHVDTVHTVPSTTILYDRAQGLLWSPEGLGADDRAGVLGILELLKRGHRPHVLFTDGEEYGGTGAREVTKTVPDNGVLYAIELDRKNGDEAVFYDCDNPEFTKYVLSFGFKHALGTFSDISILCPHWNIAGVNLSAGYYNEHTRAEYLNLRGLWRTLERVEQMLAQKPAKRFKHHTKLKAQSSKLSRHSSYSAWPVDDYAKWRYDYDLAWAERVDALSSPKTPLKTQPLSVTSAIKPYVSAAKTLNNSVKFIVEIYADDMAGELGGSETTWLRWLYDNYDELELAAEEAVQMRIDDMLMHGGGVRW